MDVDNNDIPRVTRARTRRLSTLDTDSRPSTPLIDATVERASPRPMRKTRLNSATMDLRTPTRSTRASVARGETPEPITPAAKRATRTPAKSVRKQLPLKEEDLVEEVKEEAKNEITKTKTKVDVATNISEVVVADPTRNTPSRSVDLMVTPNVTPTDQRRVTRSMSKTPPVPGLSINNIPQPQFDISNSLEEKQAEKQTKEVIENVDTPVAEQQVLQSDDSLNKESSSLNNKQVNAPTLKLQVKVKDISPDSPGKTPKLQVKVKDISPDSPGKTPKMAQEKTELIKKGLSIVDNTKQSTDSTDVQEKDISLESSDSQAEWKTPSLTQEVNAKIQQKDELVIDSTKKSNDEEGISQDDKDKSPDFHAKTNKNEEPVLDEIDLSNRDQCPEVDVNASMKQLVVPPSSDPNTDIKIVEVVLLPDLTPKTMSRVVEEIPDSKKKVDFHGKDASEADAKLKYPKTPARLNTPPVNVVKLITKETNDIGARAETPIKAMILKTRNSSTPLAKPESVSGNVDEYMVTNPPPQKIDVIEALPVLESKSDPEVQFKQEKLARRLVSEDVDEEVEEEQEDEYGICEFFDNEVEVIENYQSGDSMDSSERREIKENEIPLDGESVGSQDTVDHCSKESEDENLSFIVSDNDVEDDNDEIEELCFSSASDSIDSDVKVTKSAKKRRRIIVHDSSDEDDQKNVTADKGIKNDSDLNEKGVKMINQSKSSASENEPQIAESNKSISLSKTSSVGTSESEPSPQNDLEIEEVRSSSDEGEEHVVRKSINFNNKSIYEVPDSSDEASETNEGSVGKNSSPTIANNQNSQENDKDSQIKDKSISKEDTPNRMDEDATPDPVVEKTVEPTSKSSSFHNKQNRDDETALLAELTSCDLSHLQKMFNPLQKSRRQTLYVQGPDMGATEPKPKLKRRSEQLNSDVQPSQSFIETLAKEKSERLKRKSMSKSFCGTVDDLDTSDVEEVLSKKVKSTYHEASSVVPVKAVKEQVSPMVVDLKEQSKAQEQPKKPSDPPKDTAYYLKYCDNILQAANDAMLEQKKQRIALGKKPKTAVTSSAKLAPVDVESPSTSTAIATVAANRESEKTGKIKKNVKRLQATKQAVKHAIQLLVPDLANKEPQSLARKLSPQPQANAKNIKEKVQTVKRKKPKVVQASPVKSSDEENHHAMKRIKTSAGYVVISKLDKDQIELVKTRSGIMKVEPCTPNQKYFKEAPSTPYSRSGLAELSSTSKAIKKKPGTGGYGNVARNPATESALRFKQQIFGRSSK